MNFNDLGNSVLNCYLQEAADLSQSARWNLIPTVVAQVDQSRNSSKEIAKENASPYENG